MDLNSRIKIQIDNDVCIVSPYNLSNTKTPVKQQNSLNTSHSNSNSVSFTVSVSEDENENKDKEVRSPNVNLNELEISYKSVFLSEKKTNNNDTQLTDKTMLKNLDVKNLYDVPNKTSSLASTLEKTDKIISDSKKTSSFIKKERNESNSNDNKERPTCFTYKACGNNVNTPSQKSLNINLSKIKIQNKDAEKKENNEKIDIHNDIFSNSSSLSTSNRNKKNFIKNYLKQMLNQYSITTKKIINKPKSAKGASASRKSHSHRNNMKNPSNCFGSGNLNLNKILKHNQSSSCLILNNKGTLQPSSSALSIFNRSYQIQKTNHSSANGSKNNSQCYSNLNTPTNIKSKKIDSRNSILKHTLIGTINKKLSNTPIISSTSLSQRGSAKKIYIQTPNNLTKTKYSIPYLKKNMRTSPSPPKISKKTILKEYTSNHINEVHCSKLTNKKPVHTIKNFSNYIKKSKNNEINDNTKGRNYLNVNKNAGNKGITSSRKKITVNLSKG